MDNYKFEEINKGFDVEKLIDQHLQLSKKMDRGKEIALNKILENNFEKINSVIQQDGIDKFHKNLRQIDVTGKGWIDMAIWHLLQDCNLFWQTVEELKENLI